jgi:hypothetical protein
MHSEVQTFIDSYKQSGIAPPGVPNYSNWSSERQNVALEQMYYKSMGIEVGTIDGLVGPQTQYAREAYNAMIHGEDINFRDKEVKHTWPKQNESAMNKYFGKYGTNQVSMIMPYPMVIAWETDKTITKFSCNKKVKEPLERIFKRTLDHYGIDEIKHLRLDYFGGCLNVRKMRGGSEWSIHSWGCAVDIDPDRNQLKWGKDKAELAKPVYEKFWDFVYDEGAISLGLEKNYDFMHFQFATL